MLCSESVGVVATLKLCDGFENYRPSLVVAGMLMPYFQFDRRIE